MLLPIWNPCLTEPLALSSNFCIVQILNVGTRNLCCRKLRKAISRTIQIVVSRLCSSYTIVIDLDRTVQQPNGTTWHYISIMDGILYMPHYDSVFSIRILRLKAIVYVLHTK
ncbi:unnamed protein product [Albugo candida]|uniref:Uncharacterized protein n=1 Tax=Albugo candida TaxID=65357 RepID=A0A024FTC4_9STRA|nr:unnamed protein product [Albugo candida]|eukprot:CCI10350.1 unnamed protein product [Albugo candida]